MFLPIIEARQGIVKRSQPQDPSHTGASRYDATQ